MIHERPLDEYDFTFSGDMDCDDDEMCPHGYLPDELCEDCDEEDCL